MFTSSMVTASVEMDLALGHDIDIGNQICVLVTMQGDSTPLGPSSFKEWNMVKLCIGLGWAWSTPKVCSSFQALKQL